MKNPLISIVIPFFNQRSDFLRKCISSTLNQDYTNIEIIISDNHSTNDGLKVLTEFMDTRIKYVKPPSHVDMLDSFIFAGSCANGEYLCFLSSDDFLFTDAISTLLAIAQKYSEAVVVYGDLVFINETETVVGMSHRKKYANNSDEIIDHLQFTQNIAYGSLIKRSAYNQVGGFSSTDYRVLYTGDIYLSLKLILAGLAIYVPVKVTAIQTWSPNERRDRAGVVAIDIIYILDFISKCEPLLSRLPQNRPLPNLILQFHLRRMIVLTSKALLTKQITSTEYLWIWSKFSGFLPKPHSIFFRYAFSLPLGYLISVFVCLMSKIKNVSICV